MPFSIDQFYRANRRTLTWIIFFLLLWALRGFFGLVFLTFVFAFFSAPLVRFCQEKIHLPRRPAIVLVYLLMLTTLAGFISFVVPRVAREANALITNFDQVQTRLIEGKRNLAVKYPSLERVLLISLHGWLKEQLETPPSNIPSTQPAPGRETGSPKEKPSNTLTIPFPTSFSMDESPTSRSLVQFPPETKGTESAEQNTDTSAREDERLVQLVVNRFKDTVTQYMPVMFSVLSKGSGTMLFALLFSFLITLDITRLEKEIQTLRESRLHDFYEQTAQPVVRFAWVVGRALQAQALIASCNTLLTFIGLICLNLPSLAVLSMVVFVCSFIPVLGVFISTVPILLVALNAGGLAKAGLVIGLVVIIHAIEAYLLNPLIYGSHLKLNPVMVLIILFLGHHLFGIWGMLLGVPVTFYFLNDVFGVPLMKISKNAATPPPTQPVPSHK
ncbi:MAG TPA: AI-2E family transporter [Candidatus Sumerlaeota bacterium]|nr:AI-2E family transporter [Candidatus Sumerlaeota bacterium]